jgi:hypothetical protein
MRSPFSVLLLTAIVGCAATDYVYSPESANTMMSNSIPASRTQIPPEQPKGSVEVASFGVTALSVNQEKVPAVHVRMVVSNDGDPATWRVDATQQLIELPGQGQSAPLYVNSDVQPVDKTVPVGMREKRTIDLYYPLPATVNTEGELPEFDMLWNVDTGTRPIAQRTSFDRLEPQYYDYWDYPYGTSWPMWAGYGPYWWYDPFPYYGVSYVNPRPIVHGGGHGSTVHVGQFQGRYNATPRVTTPAATATRPAAPSAPRR